MKSLFSYALAFLFIFVALSSQVLGFENESILEASDNGELWGIENSDLTPLEVQLILSHDFS